MDDNRSSGKRTPFRRALFLSLLAVPPAHAQLALPTVFDQPLQTPIHASVVVGTFGSTSVSISGGEFGLTSGYNGESWCQSVQYQSTPATFNGDPLLGGVRVCVRQTTSALPGRTTAAALTVAGAMLVFRATTAGSLHPDDDADGDAMPNAAEAAEGRDPRAKDNDVFANARLFAMQQYRDVLGREGDAGGVTGWANLVTTGTYSRPQVIDAFVNSPEFGGIVAPVVRLYFATFLRVPDYAGLTFNAGLVRAGTVTLQQLAEFFTTSPEFAAAYGSLDNTAFVTLLYSNVLGRAPDSGGLAAWVNLLDTGTTRGQVLLGFSDSAEYQAAMANEVFTTMMYAGMLRRTPEQAGFSAWVGILDAGTLAREQVIGGFFLSTEYRYRFLP